MPKAPTREGFTYGLWVALAAPGLWWTFSYLTERSFYGEYVHSTGTASVNLLIATLAVTPALRLLPRSRWSGRLHRSRRHLGVASFGYAALHLVAYCARHASERILNEAITLEYGTGWIAMAIFTALALTSNDAAVRRLRRAWKSLHRWVYLAVGLTLVHWITTAFDPAEAWIYTGVIAAVLAHRLLPRRQSPTT